MSELQIHNLQCGKECRMSHHVTIGNHHNKYFPGHTTSSMRFAHCLCIQMAPDGAVVNVSVTSSTGAGSVSGWLSKTMIYYFESWLLIIIIVDSLQSRLLCCSMMRMTMHQYGWVSQQRLTCLR